MNKTRVQRRRLCAGGFQKRVLRDIHYNGFVVMEPFLLQGGEVGRDCRVFRDLSSGADEATMTEYITTSLKYLKKCCLG